MSHDGSEKKLTGLSHQTGENETKQLAENTDYIAVYSNNVHPYTLKPDNEGFDSEKAPKVTLYGTGDYCGKAEHYFTISAEAPAAEHTVTVTTAGNGTASTIPAKAVAGVEITLTATPNTGYHFKQWQVESPAELVITNNKFLMPDSDVEVKAIFEEDAPPAPTDPAKPSISVTGTYTYNGSEHTATVSGYDSATMDISGNTGTDAGDYTVSVTSNTGKWADGSTDAVTAAWKHRQSHAGSAHQLDRYCTHHRGRQRRQNQRRGFNDGIPYGRREAAMRRAAARRLRTCPLAITSSAMRRITTTLPALILWSL